MFCLPVATLGAAALEVAGVPAEAEAELAPEGIGIHDAVGAHGPEQEDAEAGALDPELAADLPRPPVKDSRLHPGSSESVAWGNLSEAAPNSLSQ